MKKRVGDSWMSADDYGRSLSGVGFNLLVADIDRALTFQREVLQTTVVYADPDFAAVEHAGSKFMLHADHSYLDHPMHGLVLNLDARGAGVELRVYGVDPDAAAERARQHDFTVLADAMDKPHGLRESFLIDDEGYVWAPGISIFAS